MRDRRYRPEEERGIPDGLLVGLLAFLLGLTLLVWTATGLAGVLSHGAWPTGVAFTNTPLAMRALASKPHDLASAWPETPPAELSGYGLFWGLAIGELMILVVLTIFTLGTLARWRAVRRSKTAGSDRASGAYGGYAQQPAPRPESRHGERSGAGWEQDTGSSGAYATPAPGRPAARDAYAGSAQQPGAPTAVGGEAAGPNTGNPQQPGAHAQSGTHGARTEAYAGTAEQRGPGAPGDTGWPAGGGSGAAVSPPHGAAGPDSPAEQGASGRNPHAPSPGTGTATGTNVPAPRTTRPARLLYGDPATRRPSTVQAVLDAQGPALVVTSDPTVWAETKDARAKLGPVLVYDPGHLCDTPARLHWSPTAHCEDPATAQERATALLAPVRPRALLDAAMADAAETLLRCWLHAAAVDGRPFKQLHRWAQGGSAHDAVRILRTHPKATSGLAGLLESALTAHPERREIAQQLVVRALSSLSSIHIREACTPNRADSLSLESFVNEGGTLYLVGESIEDPRTHPGAMPLLTALASDVVEHGRRMAARSSDGRLDPPMTLVLDDVAAVAPLPRLPELLATGQDQGLPTLVLLRSAEQARARWPEPLPQ
ncbi:type VI secretion protein [Streptomyces sp. NBC_00322]|uniref:type VI secretion protein n=1 Tax=Streptomyces sp. NBC_00322 TaxID=2975712 RepID=UPI002E28BC00|nr:type VI secretion protein [Streptomyces sp. NBC_00322]